MKRVIIILASAILLASCTFSEELSPDEVLKVSNTTFEFDKSANSQTLEIESYCSWDLKCDASWVTFSVTKSGEGKVKNTLSVIENESPVVRSAVAEIYNEDYGVSVKINITQGASAPYIECSRDTIRVSYISQIEKIEVESNIPWEASTDAEWIELSPKSCDDGFYRMRIEVSKNEVVESRSAVIRIVNSEYDIEEEILVTQSEWVPELKVNVEKLENISYNGSIEEIRIESNISWEASVDVDWIEISPKSGVSGVSLMTVSVGENVLEESRECIITLKNQEYSLTTEVIIQQQPLPTINGYEYVDLGLPSGLKWATCNVGADSPEEYGGYYAWGEIETKSNYYVSNSETWGESMSDISGNSTYDVARAKWGGSWRLPTKKELEELESNCKWGCTTQNGKQGFQFTGPNGNSIFLPAAGYRDESSLYGAGEIGYYWSSTPRSNDCYACSLYFGSSYPDVGSCGRSTGLSVRPVSE